MKQNILNLLLMISSVYVVDRFCTNQTGFRLSKATTHHCYPFEASLPQSVPLCLNQPFYFLGSGVQCYAFVGKDQQTVLKLFKHHHMGPSTDHLRKFMPKSLAIPLIKKREKRMLHYLESARIAHEFLPQETGVFYAHLMKTEGRLGTVTIFNKLGVPYLLDLDKTEFVLQQKVETVQQRLTTLFEENKTEEAILAMNRLLSLIEKRSQKGIKNKDPKVTLNCGFDKNNQPLEIDIGSFVFQPSLGKPDPHKKARMKGAMQLLLWVKTHYPEHLPQCRRRILDENLL